MNVITDTYYEGMTDPSYYHPTPEDWEDYMTCMNNINEEESTRRDVQTAISLQESEKFESEDYLCLALMKRFGWNSHHAEEIAELAWVELYSEKE